ncbi:MAG: hypothetical protein ABID61_02635, partial [Candidatus Micrarchaeota archaeon]
MKFSHYALIGIFVAIFFLAGCAKDNASYGCCVKSNAEQGECLLFNGTTSVLADKTFACNVSGNSNLTPYYTCNVTVSKEVTFVSGGKIQTTKVPSNLSIPICTDRTTTRCSQPSCEIMVCSPNTYNPNPIASGVDLGRDAEYGKQGDYGGISSGSGVQDKHPVINLYGAYCDFYPMDERLNTLITNTKGSLVNTFRFGIGSSFSDYDVAKYYFPMSDRFCNPYLKKITATGKDRYMNYLIYDGGTTFSSTYQVPAAKSPESIFTENVCIDSSTNSFPLPLQLSKFGGSDGTYKTAKYYTGVFGTAALSPFPPDKYDDYPSVKFKAYSFGNNSFIASNAAVPGFIEIEAGSNNEDNNLYFISERENIDRDFYTNALQWLYFTPDITARNGTARFECSQSECYSGYCDKEFYKRSVCENSVTGKDALCMCEKKTTNGKTSVECEGIYDLTRTSNPNDGIAGKTVPVTFRSTYGWGEIKEVPSHISIDATSYGWSGFVVQRESKELQFTGAFGGGDDGTADTSECSNSPTCYSDVDYYALTPSFKLNYTPKNIECVNYDKSSTSSTYQQCLKWAPSGDSQQKPVSKTIFWGEERKINETISKLVGEEIGGQIFLTQVLSNQINGYIGFSTMDTNEFQKIMLAKECNLKKDSDYVIRDTSTFGLFDSSELTLSAYQTNWIYALGED